MHGITHNDLGNFTLGIQIESFFEKMAENAIEKAVESPTDFSFDEFEDNMEVYGDEEEEYGDEEEYEEEEGYGEEGYGDEHYGEEGYEGE